MKNKLLHSFRLRATMLVAMMLCVVNAAWADTKTDVLTASDFTATNTTYTDFSGVTKTSDAVYAGNSGKDASGNIQMRSKNSNSGIVSTTSGGKVKSVKITVGSGSNTIDVYGSNTAYTAASDLYGTNKGTKIGSLTATGTITFTNDYEYVGIRSNSGAIYLSSVEIVWETSGGGGSQTETVATPTFSPAAGTYTSAQNVTISTTTTGATIYYTTDGSAPSDQSTPYTSAITVDETMTLKAIAVADGMENSAVATAAYTILDHAGTQADPYTVADAIAATPTSGTSSQVYISGIVSAFYNTSIVGDGTNYRYYISDDGTTANQLLVYKGKGLNSATFSSSDDLLIGDRVVIYGGLTLYQSASEVASGNYLVSLVRKPAAPTFSPGAGAVGAGSEVTIDCATAGATIYYSFDNTNWTEYTEPLTIDVAKTIYAKAVKDELTSDMASASYTIAVPVANPTFSLAEGTYHKAQSVTLSCATDGATIYYTTDGSTPTASNTPYTAAIAISETTTVKAVAMKDGMAQSDVVEATYTILIPAISADNVNLAFDATAGAIALSITNPVDGGVVTAAITSGNEGNWLTLGTATTSSVALTCTENDGEADRTATVTLTYTFDTNETVTKTVTVTQAYNVPDYATLPFEFNDGKSAIESTPGLTESGLGNDYGDSNALLKFDNAEDYVILKINERPGTLSFNIKNNSFSGGTFKVQTSVDGETYIDLQSYTTINGTQNEEFADLDEDVRYIKWIYTAKSSGNVGIGKIKLTKYAAQGNSAPVWSELPTPSVNVDEDYDLDLSSYVSGTPTPTIGLSTSVDNNLYGFDDGYLVFRPTEAGTYEFTFTATNSEGSSNATLTVTATAVTPATGDNYELFTGNLVEGDYIIYYDGKAMNTTVTSDRLQYEEVTPVNDIITTDNVAIVWHIAPSGDSWTIYNADADAYAASTGAKNKAQMLADGTDDKALWAVSGTGAYEFVNKQNTTNEVNANLRNNGTYGFACYATSTGGALSLYKKATPTESVTITSALYAAIVTKNNVSFYNSGVTAYIVTATNTDEATLTAVDEAPAGTPLIVKAEAAGTYNLTVINDATNVSGNLLQASNGTKGDGSTIFALGNKDGVGFYVVGDGVTVPAGKPYLEISGSAGIKSFLAFNFGTPTAISNLEAQKAQRGTLYNLAGQRVNKAVKGIFIQNGKKIVVK